MQDRKQLLGNERMGKLILKLSAPAVIGMFVQALYNVVDTIFVGRGVGSDGIAGLSLVFPIHMIMLGAGFVLGIGGASLISRSLGANDHEKADHTMGNVITMVILLGLFVSILGLYFQEPLLRLFGASEKVMPYSMDYLSILLKGMVFFVFLVCCNNIIRSEGSAVWAMVSMFISAGVNIVLDPIFIFGLKMGVRGAAYATVIAWITACAFQVYYFASSKSLLKPRKIHYRPDIRIIKEILCIGSSSFARSAASSATIAVINRMLGTYGGDLSIAVFGVVHKIIMFVFMPVFGICQGLQPIVGFNFGARNYVRVRQGVILSVKITTLIAVAGYIPVMLMPGLLVSIFSKEPELIMMGKTALKIVALALPVVASQMVGVTLFQALGRAGPAFFLSLARQVLFVVPLVYLLPRLIGVFGIFTAFPVSDLLAFVITAILMLRELKTLHAMPD